MKTYAKGDTFKGECDDYETFGIHEFDSEGVLSKEHAQKIEVYGDEELRDKIISFLNAQNQSVGAAPENVEGTVEYVGSDSLEPTNDQFSRFEKELEDAINRTCMENGSNTPDFILAKYLVNCLKAFNKASKDREKWYGKELKI